jgi:ribosomal protein L24E
LPLRTYHIIWGGRAIHLSKNERGIGLAFFLGIGFAPRHGEFGLFKNRGFATMGLPCIQCSKSFPPGHTFEFIVYNEEAYFFCSEGCKDNWVSELNDPTNCDQFPLCEHLQKYVGDEAAGLLMEAMQMESERLCGKCPHFIAKNQSPT